MVSLSSARTAESCSEFLVMSSGDNCLVGGINDDSDDDDVPILCLA